ncbi:DNA cytosine methyltransferase [Dickeya fangzhongdai]|uniref:DNA cytosine methyltransferase n=1 Tax=Dickeya fangzhongdai TaxID=1778540 RepID=UPI0008FFBAB2|nr:DNA cytosine methyltransferase [Dickeya fangzhongdai]
MRTIEMCAGAGGQALGLHKAGFKHSVLIEIDEHACATLRHNNEALALKWGPILQDDLRRFAEEDAVKYRGQVELVAGGVPCPPFSKAGLQLGKDDERDLFPAALQVVRAVKPIAVMIENVAGLLDNKFLQYRDLIRSELKKLGYKSEWRLLQASDFGVPQLRPRAILVAIEAPYFDRFRWPEATTSIPISVGEALYDLMSSEGWAGASSWKERANSVAPTLVGGSKKHGGPDLGPSRAKRQWQSLGVYAHRVGADNEIPGPDFKGVLLRDGSIKEGYENMPLLNVRMAARIQGFPDEWSFIGSKTNAYRQVGNAFPPPVAQAVGESIRAVILAVKQERGNAA